MNERRKINRMGRMLMGALAVMCSNGDTFADAGWADGVAITNEAAFFAELDLSRPALEPVRAAFEEKDWPVS